MADKFGAGIIQGSTSVSIPVELWTTSTNAPMSSIAFTSVTGAYWRQGAAMVTIAMVSLTAVNSAWTSGGWVRWSADAIGSKKYRLDVPDAAFASGADFVMISVQTSGGYASFDEFWPLIGISDSAIQVALSSLTVGVSSLNVKVDTAVGTRATATVWTSAVAGNIDTTISSRASAGVWTSTVAGRIDANVSSAVSAASLALTAFDPVTKTQANALAASLALTAFDPVTKTQANALAASLALAAYTGVSTALTAYGVSTIAVRIDDTITSRSSATVWTSTVAGRIDANVSSAVSAASLALTAFDPVTKTQANALAASLALAAYTGVSTALSAYGVPTIAVRIDDTITSRASATVWTSTVAGRIDAAVSTRAAAGDSMALTGAAVDSILDDAVEGSYTLRQLIRLMAASLAGKVSGGGTATIIFRDVADAKDRITATVDSSGNRTAITVDVT